MSGNNEATPEPLSHSIPTPNNPTKTCTHTVVASTPYLTCTCQTPHHCGATLAEIPTPLHHLFTTCDVMSCGNTIRWILNPFAPAPHDVDSILDTLYSSSEDEGVETLGIEASGRLATNDTLISHSTYTNNNDNDHDSNITNKLAEITAGMKDMGLADGLTDEELLDRVRSIDNWQNADIGELAGWMEGREANIEQAMRGLGWEEVNHDGEDGGVEGGLGGEETGGDGGDREGGDGEGSGVNAACSRGKKEAVEVDESYGAEAARADGGKEIDDTNISTEPNQTPKTEETNNPNNPTGHIALPESAPCHPPNPSESLSSNPPPEPDPEPPQNILWIEQGPLEPFLPLQRCLTCFAGICRSCRNKEIEFEMLGKGGVASFHVVRRRNEDGTLEGGSVMEG